MFPPSVSAANASASALGIGKCALCHLDTNAATSRLNSYGNAVKRNYPNPRPPGGLQEFHRIQAIRAAESLNSDDAKASTPTLPRNLYPVGTTILDEIKRGTQPGWNGLVNGNVIYAGKSTDSPDQPVASITAPANMGILDPPPLAYARLGPSIALAASGNHTCAITGNDGMLCWGANYYGQLGDGTLINRPLAVAPASVSGVSGMAVGYAHTCAVDAVGGVRCWGSNSSGQLGDGTRVDRPTAVGVSGMGSGIAMVAAGAAHTCALTVTGGVRCWGSNASGALGDGTTTDRVTPVAVSGLATGVSAIAVNASHSCALVAGGVKCWGGNFSGQLGSGSTLASPTPVDVIGLTSGVVAISAGNAHTCAVNASGAVYCWGGNDQGQLGDNSTAQRTTPVQVTGLSSGMTAVSTNFFHTCALGSDGVVKCWGANSSGQLGDGTNNPRPMPVDVAGLAGPATAIAVGGDHTCVLLAGQRSQCFGYNNYGQLGEGSTLTRWSPVDVRIAFSPAVATGARHSCAVNSRAGINCWGENEDGLLGNFTRTRSLTAVTVPGVDDAAAVVVGEHHACMLTLSGGVRCWGMSFSGELGDGTGFDSDAPVDVVGLRSGVLQISAGGSHTCALTSAGGIMCWGGNYAGQLGDGTTLDSLVPIAVAGLGSGIAAVSAGEAHTCAVTSAGAVKCWGNNGNGQLGDGTTTQRSTPVNVNTLASGVKLVAAGGHSCALTTGGAVKCWGPNLYGQLGDGSTTQRLTPVNVSTLSSGVAAISVGAGHTCAVTIAGGGKCWGSNFTGEIGDGTHINRPTPVNVGGLTQGVIQVAAGSFSTCALVGPGGARCWGRNHRAQLGDGTLSESVVSSKVQFLESGKTISLSSNYENLGFAVVGDVASADVALRNRTSSAVAIASITTVGHFSQTNTCVSSVPPHGQCRIHVVFAPPSTGPSFGGLFVYSDAEGSPHYIELEGEGIENPGALQFTSATYSVGEGAGSAVIAVWRQNGIEGEVAVTVGTATGGTAVAGVDYTPTTTTLYWSNGDSESKSFSIPIVNDPIAEPGKTINLVLSAPVLAALGTPATAVLTIVDNDTVPSPPTGVAATAGTSQATVTFATPASAGTSPITSYTVTSNPAGGVDINSGTLALSHVVTGLTNGVSYTFNVVATSAAGSSAPSAPSNSVTPLPSYTLSRTAVHGSISANPGGPSYLANTQVQLTATPDAGYRFSGWTGDAIAGGTQNPYNIIMNGNKTVGAGFLPLATCSYAVVPPDLPNLPKTGANPVVTITAPSGCPVGAASMQPWVSVGAITPSSGTTTVQLLVSPNPGPARATVLVIAGRLYLVTQLAGP